MKVINPPIFAAKDSLNLGQALTSLCTDALCRYYILRNKRVHYSSVSYNAQGKPLDDQVSFEGNLRQYQEKCETISRKHIHNIEKTKSRINILYSQEKYLDFSKESRKISQEKFLEIFNKGFLIKKGRDFYLDVDRVIKKRNIENYLKQIETQPKNFDKTLKQLLRDVRTPLQITKPRLFATPLPIYLCQNCSEVFIPKKRVSDPRMRYSKCPKCNKKTKNDIKDTIDPLFDLSVQSYSLNPHNHIPDIQICGRNMATRYIYYTLLTHAAIDNSIAFKNLIIHNILRDDFGKRLSNKNKNLIDISEIDYNLQNDAIRYALFKSLSFKSQTVNLSKNFFEEGQKTVYRISNLKKFFKIHNITFSEINLDKQTIRNFYRLMENLELRGGFDFGQKYLSQLSRDIKEEHDSRKLGKFLEKAIRYKTAIFMIEPFMPEITGKSRKELSIRYFK